VGVFPLRVFEYWYSLGFPHARGGVSYEYELDLKTGEFSPRPWGCFYLEKYGREFTIVFPTPVGVFLLKRTDLTEKDSFPHARGGVSIAAFDVPLAIKFSPRPWGCFLMGPVNRQGLMVFPTPVGVFLLSCYLVTIT